MPEATETDVTQMRELIVQVKELACVVRGKTEKLHCEPQPEQARKATEVPALVGLEFIGSLKAIRDILLCANDALTGYNGQ